MSMANSTYFRRILIIEDIENESIYDVIGRMEVLIEIFNKDKNYHQLIPFLYTYYLVTKAVVEKYTSQKKFFANIEELEKLDVYFASLYFKPLLAYLENRNIPKPWQTYFEYTSTNGIPFLQLMLGINAHINADLFTAIKILNYKYEKDFFLINDILLDVMPKSMKFLIKEHDLVGVSSIVFKNFIENEFHLVVERWRSEAWANAKLSSLSANQYKINNQTEEIGKNLIDIFNDLYHLKGIMTGLNKVNSLSVGLIR